MTGMSMPQQTWYGAVAGYLGMWMAMMVPMMLPSLVPMLSRYRRSVRGADGIHLHGLTALVGVGYFVVWAVLGTAAYAAGAGVMAVEMRWEKVAQWTAGRGRRGASRGGRRAAHLVEGAAAGALPRRVRVRLPARAQRPGRVAAWPQVGRAVQPLLRQPDAGAARDRDDEPGRDGRGDARDLRRAAGAGPAASRAGGGRGDRRGWRADDRAGLAACRSSRLALDGADRHASPRVASRSRLPYCGDDGGPTRWRRG